MEIPTQSIRWPHSSRNSSVNPVALETMQVVRPTSFEAASKSPRYGQSVGSPPTNVILSAPAAASISGTVIAISFGKRSARGMSSNGQNKTYSHSCTMAKSASLQQVEFASLETYPPWIFFISNILPTRRYVKRTKSSPNRIDDKCQWNRRMSTYNEECLQMKELIRIMSKLSTTDEIVQILSNAFSLL